MSTLQSGSKFSARLDTETQEHIVPQFGPRIVRLRAVKRNFLAREDLGTGRMRIFVLKASRRDEWHGPSEALER